jgi:hypothetical protein
MASNFSASWHLLLLGSAYDFIKAIKHTLLYNVATTGSSWAAQQRPCLTAGLLLLQRYSNQTVSSCGWVGLTVGHCG